MKFIKLCFSDLQHKVFTAKSNIEEKTIHQITFTTQMCT